MALQLNSKYKLIKKLGAGAFGEIFLGKDLKTEEGVAIKLEPIKAQAPQLIYESKIYQYFQSDPNCHVNGIPKVISAFTEEKYNCMVMELLGSSLEDLFNQCGRKFSLKTVIMLADQLLQNIEYVHSRYFLHRDIKPDNFLIGRGQNQNKVYIIDFGLAKKYFDRTTKQHIPYKEGKSLTGTARYASVNTHLGIEQGRRDDIESIGYVLVYFLKGSLPWQNMKATKKEEKYKLIMEKKLGTRPDQLCEGLPVEFSHLIQYARAMKFEEKADYNYLRTLFKDLAAKMDIQMDFEFDWVLKGKEVKKEKEEIQKLKIDLEIPTTEGNMNSRPLTQVNTNIGIDGDPSKKMVSTQRNTEILNEDVKKERVQVNQKLLAQAQNMKPYSGPKIVISK